jgi:spore maturation protein CgeB
LERRGVWSIIMSADDQHQFIGPLDRTGEAHQLRVARQADLYWTGWRLGARLVDSIGGNAWFAPHAADPERYRPISCEKSLDVVFVGGCNRVRLDIVSGLSRYFNVSAFGRGWPAGSVSFDETIQLFSRSRVVLGIGGIGHSFAIQMIKGRDFEVAMCGATYVTSAYSEVAECFDVGREIACYLSLEDCVEVVAKLLDDSELRTSMGHAARARSVRDHTWDRRVRSLFDLFGAASDRGMADDASTAPVRRS